ncbi:MAG: RNA polymerase sigma-70 factor [Bacteroidetes bacterium]|nr:RNA polymerase sigma-70 factor [Bacteroidota bacterium]
MPTNEPYTDQELLQLLRQDDEQAFTILYQRYRDRMLVTDVHRLGNLEEAREIVQDVFCGLWKRRASLAIDCSLNTYLASAVKYEVFRRFAAQSRQQRYQQQVIRDWQEAANDTIDQLKANELRSQLDNLVKNLPEKCRIVYRLSREKGYSQKQIAAELRIAEKTVEAHLSSALRKLRLGLSHLFAFFL